MSDAEPDFNDLPFSESDLTDDPFDLFRSWYENAIDHRPGDWLMANAMTLSTCDQAGKPRGRIVLMKAVLQRGIVFFTNYESSKAHELAANPFAAATFYWPHRARQIRMAGGISKTSREVSESYFQSRPRGSQVSATVSPQSQIIDRREELESQAQELDLEYRGTPIPVPENWGGYELQVDQIEFWQSRSNRLHDRFLYRFENGEWSRCRLAP